MARIRSVHPGLFTDEAFVGLSDAAQIFFIGLWCEADDQGVFPWKPPVLKMRIRPAHNDNIPAILDQLTAANFVAPFEIDGAQYGVIRNFRRFQRPKKPKAVHPMPDEFRTYAGISADDDA